MKNKNQIFIVRGGMTFKNKEKYIGWLKTREISIENKKGWKSGYMQKKLDDFEIIMPKMPLVEDAKYEEWKINFERYFPFIRDDVILIGNSLGGIFLAKYLSENKFPKKILSVYLVCPPYDNSLPGEDLVGGFKLKSDLSLLDKCSNNLYLMFSEDDDVVPLSQAEKYGEKLKNAEIIIYKNKNGHFQVEEFPEIVKMIKENVKKK